MNDFPLLLANLERLIQLALKLDPFIRETLKTHNGLSCKITITEFNLSWIMMIADGTIALRVADNQPTDCRLKAPLTLLLRLFLTKDNQLLSHSKVFIEGCPSLLKTWMKILSAIEIDWEEQLSHFTGDVAAHQAGNIVRQSIDFLTNTHRTFERHLIAYLQEESNLLISKPTLSEFLDEVDEIKMATDRLAARIQQIQTTCKETP